MKTGIYTLDPALLKIDDETADVTMSKIIERPEALVEGIIRDDAPCVVLIGAAPKTGKTHLAVSLCIEIARGGSLLGYQCKKGKSLYINLDSSRAEFEERLQDTLKAAEMTADEMKNFSHKTLPIMPVKTLADILIRDKADSGLSLVVIDALCDIFRGEDWSAYDENDAGDVMTVFFQAKRISEALGCPIVIVHHFRKASDGTGFSSDPMENFRGSGAITAAADTIIALSQCYINKETRKNILKDRDNGEFLKGLSVSIFCRSFPDPEPFRAWMQDRRFFRDSGEFVRGKPGPQDKDREAFEAAFEKVSKDHGGVVKVSKLAAALGLRDNRTVYERGRTYGYVQGDKATIVKKEQG